MNETELGDKFLLWALDQSSIHVLIMIGSRTRRQGGGDASDEGSDWDYQVVTSHPGVFLKSGWARSAGLSKPIVYVTRRGRLGRVAKVSGIFSAGELDVALLPLFQLRLAVLMLETRLLRFFPSARRALAELAMVLVPGYRVLKGSPIWENFLRRVVLEIPPQRLTDLEIVCMADAYVCDYLSTHRKLARGELLAAQRWLHMQLAEANFRLLHELRLRSAHPSFPDARRIETLPPDRWHDSVRVDAAPEWGSLLRAIEKNAQTFRELMVALVGPGWRWPDLSSRIR